MRYVPALILDAVFVLVFAVIGRASHDENPLGFLITAWPFIVALVVGHAIAALLPARPRRPWSLAWGVVVWVVTVAGGILLRVASGDTAQVPFIIVAALVLALFLVGWRALAGLLRQRRVGGADADAGADDQESDAEIAVEDSEPGLPKD
jgi:FtsH-binding integral membrane protein